jgi:hypothetical protein
LKVSLGSTIQNQSVVGLTLGNGVVIGQGESLLGDIRNHDDRRAPSEELTDDSTGVCKRFELVHGNGSVRVTVADLDVLLSDTVKNIGSLGGNLEEPRGGAAGGILGSEEEGEDSLGNLVIVEHAEEGRGLLDVVGLALLLGLAPAVRLDHGQNPGIHNTGNLTTSGHANLALGSTLGELGQDHISSLLAVPRLGVRKDNGEVDKLESSGNEVVVLGDLGNSLIGNVVTDESAARYSTHDLTELVHERNGLAAGVLGHLEEVLEVSVVSLLLTGQVKFESLAGEETIETLAEINMSLSVEENPVVVSKKLRGNVDDCGLDIGRRVEDLASHITSGSDNDKPKELHVSTVNVLLPYRRPYLWKIETQLRGPLLHLAW